MSRCHRSVFWVVILARYLPDAWQVHRQHVVGVLARLGVLLLVALAGKRALPCCCRVGLAGVCHQRFEE